MKIRVGFVSNSSSTSYVIVVKQDDHNEVVNGMHPYYKAWFGEWEKDCQDLFGEKVYLMTLQTSTEDEEPFEFDGELPPEAEKYWGSIWDEKGEKWIEEEDHDVKHVSVTKIMNKYKTALKDADKECIFNEESC